MDNQAGILNGQETHHLQNMYLQDLFGKTKIIIYIYIVLDTYAINASHSKKLSSLIGPATIPSGGSKVNSEKFN